MTELDPTPWEWPYTRERVANPYLWHNSHLFTFDPRLEYEQDRAKYPS